MMGWIRKLLSQDPTASSSRTLQAFIAVNVTAMLWVVLASHHWFIQDNTRLVLITLITGGAGSYIVNKLTEGKNDSGSVG